MYLPPSSQPLRRTAVLGLAFVAILAGCTTQDATGMAQNSTSNLEDGSTTQVAEAAYSIGDYAEAAALFERASARDPKSAPAMLGLGKSYAALGQNERGYNALLAAQKLDVRNPQIYTELGNMALSQGRPALALEHFEKALSYDRTNLKALTGKAVSYDSLSQHAQAQAVYQQALKIYPTNFALLNNYGLSQALSGAPGNGISLLQELVSDPSNGELAKDNLAIAYALADRPNDAKALLRGILSANEIEQTLKLYAQARSKQLAGEPIGMMIFQ